MIRTLRKIQKYQNHGIQFHMIGDGLKVDIPKDVTLSESSANKLKELKPDIIKALNPCPARCLQTGRCYAVAWFQGIAGSVTDCNLSECQWNDRRVDVMANGHARATDGRVIPFCEYYTEFQNDLINRTHNYSNGD